MRLLSPPRTPLADQPPDRIVLRDGSVATLRLTEAGDHDAMQAFFRSLSPESRYTRFFTPGEPAEALIDRFCTSIDPTRGVTLVAMRTFEHQPRFAGVRGSPPACLNASLPWRRAQDSRGFRRRRSRTTGR